MIKQILTRLSSFSFFWKLNLNWVCWLLKIGLHWFPPCMWSQRRTWATPSKTDKFEQTWQVWHIWANLSDSEYPDSWSASAVILSRAAKGILIQLFLSNILLQYTFSIIQYLPPVFYVFYLKCFVGEGRWIVKARLGAFAARSRTRFCFLTGRLPVFAS